MGFKDKWKLHTADSKLVVGNREGISRNNGGTMNGGLDVNYDNHLISR